MRAALVALLVAAACGPPPARARTTFEQPVFPREREAFRRVAHRRCSGAWSLLFPGIGQLCHGKNAVGGTMLALGAAELTTGIVVARRSPEGTDHPGAAVPLLALTDLWAYSQVDLIFDLELARQLRFVPQDTPGELALAPFNPRVLARTDVWVGVLATTALGVGVSLLVDESASTDHLGDDANLFGAELEPLIGYPLAGAVGVGLFSHVAVSEEALFRGLIQSRFARRWGENAGWMGASLLFGAGHLTNLYFVPADQRLEYAAIGVPFITAIGAYLGLSYRWNDYSLAPPVAIHFWYNFLLSAVFFALDPDDSPISASITLPL